MYEKEIVNFQFAKLENQEVMILIILAMARMMTIIKYIISMQAYLDIKDKQPVNPEIRQPLVIITSRGCFHTDRFYN